MASSHTHADSETGRVGDASFCERELLELLDRDITRDRDRSLLDPIANTPFFKFSAIT